VKPAPSTMQRSNRRLRRLAGTHRRSVAMSTSRATLVLLLPLVLVAMVASAQAPPPPPPPPPAAVNVAIPPDAEQAKGALAKSPRHGEWVDVKMPDGKTLLAW
jgi:hypothetical protein